MKYILFLLLLPLSGSAFGQGQVTAYFKAKEAYYQGDYKTALKHIDKALAMDKGASSYYHLKSKILWESKKYAEAIEHVNIAIEISPDEMDYLMTRGIWMISASNPELAIKDFSTILVYSDVDSVRLMAYMNRGIAKNDIRDFESGYRDMMKAYEIDSNDVVVLSNLSTVCDEVGRGDETLKYLLRVIEIDPDLYPAYGNIGFKYQEMGDHQKAVEYFNKVLEMKPDEPLGYSNRSFNLLKLGDTKNAMKDINKSIELYPLNSYAFKIKGLIYLEMGQSKKACKEFESALELGYTKMYGKEVFELMQQNCK